MNFNPRAPHGARRRGSKPDSRRWPISIHALRMERDALLVNRLPIAAISIHALRMERDLTPVSISADGESISIHALRMERDYIGVEWENEPGISIHALRMERDPVKKELSRWTSEFQSTRSAWSATKKTPSIRLRYSGNFNPRAPHGARRAGQGPRRAGELFQSTRSAWSATLAGRDSRRLT